jgi:hypothetical protein
MLLVLIGGIVMRGGGCGWTCGEEELCVNSFAVATVTELGWYGEL